MKKTSIVGSRLRALREDHDLTQKQLGEILRVNRRTYGAYENGEISMTPETLLAIAEYYHISTDYLLGKSDHLGMPTQQNRLRDLREDHDMTQAQIARVLDMSQTGYSKYETGENDIPTAVLIRLSRYYNVSIDYLLGESDCPDRR